MKLLVWPEEKFKSRKNEKEWTIIESWLWGASIKKQLPQFTQCFRSNFVENHCNDMLCLFEMLIINRNAPLLVLGPWEELAVKRENSMDEKWEKSKNFRNGNKQKKWELDQKKKLTTMKHQILRRITFLKKEAFELKLLNFWNFPLCNNWWKKLEK